MKKLTIIRHAKSDWSFDVPDMERPISKRGKNDVKIMAELIDTVDCFPQIIYSSPSKRTVQTYEFFLKYSTVFKNIEFQDFKLSNYVSEGTLRIIGQIVSEILIKKPIYKVENSFAKSFIKGVRVNEGKLILKFGL